jgi:spermidine/putrescine transport system substrate-binding protein
VGRRENRQRLSSQAGDIVKRLLALLFCLTFATCSGSGGRLNLFTWSDYLDPKLASEFEKAAGVKLNIDYYDTNEAMLAKLKAGGLGQYDVVIASDYAVEILRRENLLEQIDTSRIPNFRNIDRRFRNLPFDPRNRFSVPYQWGTTGLGVRTDLMKPIRSDLDTWRLVFDSTYAVGPIAMLSDERETIGAALIYLGFSANSTDSTELSRAEQLLKAQQRRVSTYAPLSTARDLLASGDVVVAHNSSGDIQLGRSDAPGMRYVIPREGAIMWTDNMVIPVKAPNPAAAHKFINFILDGTVGGRLSNFTKYATPNSAALPFVDPALRRDSALYPDSTVMHRLQYLHDVGASRRVYDELWSRLRSGG